MEQTYVCSLNAKCGYMGYFKIDRYLRSCTFLKVVILINNMTNIDYISKIDLYKIVPLYYLPIQ